MSQYGMSRMEIAWDLPIGAGMRLVQAISERLSGERTTPDGKDPTKHFDRLLKQWQQQQN